MSDAKKRKVLDQARQNVCDVVLQCYDGDIECHRDVLINGSPYFKVIKYVFHQREDIKNTLCLITIVAKKFEC